MYIDFIFPDTRNCKLTNQHTLRWYVEYSNCSYLHFCVIIVVFSNYIKNEKFCFARFLKANEWPFITMEWFIFVVKLLTVCCEKAQNPFAIVNSVRFPQSYIILIRRLLDAITACRSSNK